MDMLFYNFISGCIQMYPIYVDTYLPTKITFTILNNSLHSENSATLYKTIFICVLQKGQLLL